MNHTGKCLALTLLALVLVSTGASAKSLLFVGNSFTFAQGSALKHYRADTVTDLNGEGIGGVPALFKLFAQEAGTDYDVSLETAGGKGLDFHYAQKLAVLDRAWDEVVLQSYSTLDEMHPGNPALLVQYTKLFVDLLHRRNPAVKIYLDATWSRADQTYPDGKPWHGKPIEQMGLDVQRGYEQAAAAAPTVTGIIPVGLAWNRAFKTGFADSNPYDGIAFGQVDLWTYDHYHASAFGYYLEALMIFGKITGLDPLSLGDKDKGADDMGFSRDQTHALQQIAHDELAAQVARPPAH
jgi:hypothetical protein